MFIFLMLVEIVDGEHKMMAFQPQYIKLGHLQTLFLLHSLLYIN